MTNSDIRSYAKKKSVFLWEIAMKLNINDGNFSRKLRKPLSKEQRSKIMHYIDEIYKEKNEKD